jgi:hypothetical protein
MAPVNSRGRIGRCDELRGHSARRTKDAVIEGCQILLHGATGSLGLDLLAPLVARDRTLLVGVCYNQAGIDRKAFATDQTGLDARLHHTLEHAPEDIVGAEAFITGARERRMVGNLVLDAQAAEMG